MNKIFKYIT